MPTWWAAAHALVVLSHAAPPPSGGKVGVQRPCNGTFSGGQTRSRGSIANKKITNQPAAAALAAADADDDDDMMVLRYNNDLTNILEWKPGSESGSSANLTLEIMLDGTVSETAILHADSLSLAPGFCMIPWWSSKLWPLEEHVRWWESTFGLAASHSGWAVFVDHVLSGGSFLGEFIHATKATTVGSRPMLSWRMQDRQFTDHPMNSQHEIVYTTRSLGFATLSQFWYEHRNDSAFMVTPFNVSAPAPQHTATMSWVNPQVVQYRRSLLLELVALHNETIGGVELDYERDPAFFPSCTAQDRRTATMRSFVTTVRAAVGPGRTLGLRVPPSEEMLADIGLPIALLAEWLHVGIVQYVTFGIGFFGFQPSASEFAFLVSKIRQTTARGQILFEVTSMLRYGCATPPQTAVRDRIPPLALVTAAHLAYASGADGIAAFNFAYYRPFQGPADQTGGVPPFQVLASLRNRSWAAAQPQLYFLSHDGIFTSNHTPASGVTGVDSKMSRCVESPCTIQLDMMPPTGGWQQHGLMRLNLVESPWTYSKPRACPISLNVSALAKSSMDVTMNGVTLRLATAAEVEQEQLASQHNWSSWPAASFVSWVVPAHAVRAGRNVISLRVMPTPSEIQYTVAHTGAVAGGDKKRWRFSFPHTSPAWKGARITGNRYTRLSLSGCQGQCDADSACRGVYFQRSAGGECYTLHTLAVGATGLDGTSYLRHVPAAAARAGDERVYAADLSLVYLDVTMPRNRSAV
jgi:hypothetical protein